MCGIAFILASNEVNQERIQAERKAIAEGVQNRGGNAYSEVDLPAINGIEGLLNEVRLDVEDLKDEIEALNEAIENLKEQVEKNTEAIETLMDEIKGVKEDVEDLKNALE